MYAYNMRTYVCVCALLPHMGQLYSLAILTVGFECKKQQGAQLENANM